MALITSRNSLLTTKITLHIPFFALLRHHSFLTKVAGREGRLKSTERPRSQGPLLKANGSSSLPIGNWNHSIRVKLSITCVIFAYHEMLPTYRFTCLSLNTLRLSASIKCLPIRYEQMPHACTCLPVQVSVTTKSAKNRKNISTNIFWRSFDGLSCMLSKCFI